MLKINLLPAYVAQRRITNRLLALYISLFVVIVVGLGAYDLLLYRQIAPLTAQTDQANAIKSQIDALNGQAAAATATLAPIQANMTFINDIETYNLAYIKLYQTLARYTSKQILYNSTSVSGSTMTISAYTPSIADLGRYLQVMYTEPDASAVSISAIPGYGSQNPDKEDNVSLPTGVVGRLPGVAQPITSFTVYRGKIVRVNSGGGAGGGRATGGNRNGYPGGGYPGGGYPGGQGQGGYQPPPSYPPAQAGNNTGGTGGLFNARRDGFPVTVTLTLKQPLSPPNPTGTVTNAGQAGPGGPGAPGGPGGPPPGFGGRPGA